MMSPSVSFVGTAVLSDGRVLAVGTDGAENLLVDAESWAPIVSWRGKEVTACGAVDSTIVCAALDGIVYAIRSDWRVITFAHDDTKALFNAVGTLAESVALIGGNGGRLITLDLRAERLMRLSLSEFGIAKPGRDVLRISRAGGGGALLTGKKELLVAHRGNKWADLAPPPLRETFLYDSAVVDETVWSAGMLGAQPVLVSVPLEGGARMVHDLPYHEMRAPALCGVGDRLVVASTRVLVGVPGQWTEVALRSQIPAIAVIPDRSARTVLVVGYTGTSERVRLP